MKPTWTSGRPPLASASTRRSDDSLSMVSGFSHRAYLPCSRQASTCSSWTKPGEAMTTASTSGSAMRPRGSSTLRTPSKAAARSAARAVSGSDTATRRAPATLFTTRSAWSAPIMPTPITPMRRSFSGIYFSSPVFRYTEALCAGPNSGRWRDLWSVYSA